MAFLRQKSADELTTSPGQHRAGLGWLALSGTIISASLMLWWLDVGFGDQLRLAVLLLVTTLAGSVIARLPRFAHPDTVTFGIVSFLFGLAVLGFFGFIVTHRALFAVPMLGTPAGRYWVAFAPVAILGAAGALQTARRFSFKQVRIEPLPIALLLAIAVGLTAVTLFEFYQDGTVAGRHNIDRTNHVVAYPSSILETGLPQEVFQHRGLEITLLALGGLHSEDIIWHGVVAYKVLTVLFYFVLGYATYAFGRYGLSVEPRPALLAGVLVGIFSAIYPLPWAMADLERSGYLGFFSPAGSFYHNANQLISHGMSVMGLLLVALAWQRHSPTFTLGTLLIGYASLFKPAFIFYAGPTFFLMLPFLRRQLSQDLVLGYICLIAVPASWALYPHVMGGVEMSTSLTWQPFAFSRHWVTQAWDNPALANPWLLAALVTFSSFALPLGVIVVLAARNGWSAVRWRAAFEKIPNQPVLLFLYFFSLLSLVGGIGLVQPHMIYAGNLTWGTVSAYLCFLPLLLQVASNSSSRCAGWALHGLTILHVLAGVRHLIRYVARGMI